MYESGEDYLEAKKKKKNDCGIVRSIDVAHKLNVSKPSVSRAMGILKDEGFIYFDESQHILFTEKGLQKAQNIYNRHRLLTEFLMKVTGVSEEQAEKNACRVEHVIDADIVAGIKSFMEKNSN